MGISDSVSWIAWRIGKFILCLFNFFFLNQGLEHSCCPCPCRCSSEAGLELWSSCLYLLSSGYRWEGIGPFSFSRKSSFRPVSSLGPFLPSFVPLLTLEASMRTKDILNSTMFPACRSSWETSLHFQTLAQWSSLEKDLLFLLAEDPVQGLVHSKHTLPLS